MPELPEVEHVARSLNRLVSGRTITAARLLRDRLAPDTSKAAFARRLKNSQINFVHRRGKHILLDLSGDHTLITHLRMTGSFSLLTPDSSDPKFTHAVFFLDDDSRLVFNDQRHFGLMKIVRTSRLFEAPELSKLAPEPFSDDFSQSYVLETVRRSKRPIKELLLDQTRFCGLGNIYAVEVLYLAKIDPRTASSKLSTPRSAGLHATVRQVLAEAIEYSDTIDIDPENLEKTYFGENGWRVYDREGQPCFICNKPIKRIKQSGRSTFYCPGCQKK
jgi:formamidopyrimidine-DNA glycosylase